MELGKPDVLIGAWETGKSAEEGHDHSLKEGRVRNAETSDDREK